MPVKRRIPKFIALPLAAAALAAATAIDAQSVGAQTRTGALCTTASERGYPNAVPPILPPPPCSVLAAIRREEAFERQEFWYDPPSTARYSNAEMNAYVSKSK
jgi:hypothetical protein